MTAKRRTQRDLTDGPALLLLVAVWSLITALVGLGGDFPLNDDWAYFYSAQHLVATGKLRMLDWVAPSVATHALWGAAAMRVFGESYVVLRAGTLLWALVALGLVYALARRSSLPPRTALVAALLLAVSPWFVNLSFTFMTDVPWLAMMLGALLACAHALARPPSRAPRWSLLLLSGALVGAASLTRQFAIVTAPAFAWVIALDARKRAPFGSAWRWPATGGCLAFGGPLTALFVPFSIWYARVHGATIANQGTLDRIREVQAWNVFVHVFSAMHYAGLWLFPLALALLVSRRWREVVSRRASLIAVAVLGGFALVLPLTHPDGVARMLRPASTLHPLMPYLSNVFSLAGLGPPTTTDAYWGSAALPHEGIALGVALTVASTLGGAVGVGVLARSIRGPFADDADAMPRRLFVGFALTYLLWHLSTATFLFDRYLLPVLPIVVLLALHAMPRCVARSPIVVACLVLSGLMSAAGTREYLSWNDARDRAVKELLARGVPAGDIDGGFEVNGPLDFQAFVARTGRVIDVGSFWVQDAPYRISFSPSPTPACADEQRYPYWTWSGGGERAMYVLHCPR